MGGRPYLLDVSEHQERPRFRPLWEEGFDGVITKMSEGTGYVDPDGVDNLSRIISSDMIPGCYHFLWGGMSASKQAAFFLRQIREVCDPRDVLLFVDVEISNNMSQAQHPAFRDVKAFLHTLQDAFPGKRLGIYSGYYWREGAHLGNPLVGALDLAEPPLIWDAHYFNSRVDSADNLYGHVPAGYWDADAFGGEPADILQFADSCKTSQFVGDVNSWSGTYAELKAQAGGRYGIRAPRR